MKRAEHVQLFTQVIWKWFDTYKRTLPWRDLFLQDDTERAYQILVSEVMLQQTQVERVKIIFRNFLERFPTLKDLAGASNKEVILAWRGMGYNSRALRLRDAAKTIVEERNGIFPREMEDLLSIKGIGHYTAAAVRNFAFQLATPCLDTNIRRVLHRAFIGAENPDGTWKRDDQFLLKLAEEVLHNAISDVGAPRRGAPTSPKCECIPRDAANWHAALMDFGSLVCTKTRPKWDICPLTNSGLMKAAYKVKSTKGIAKESLKKEPGRFVGTQYIPNRIFRGKMVEELRDASAGLAFDELGQRICLDWSPGKHKKWLQGIIEALQKDHMIVSKGERWSLAE